MEQTHHDHSTGERALATVALPFKYLSRNSSTAR
jgi:hypothetical protein